MQKRLLDYAGRDSLTGLYNRRGIEDWLSGKTKNADDYCYNVSCGFIDIDFFKKYNDCFGHICGDECLKNLCSEIQNLFNGSNCAVCRFGGEEIIVIVIGEEKENAKKLFVKLKHHIENLKIPLSDSDDGKYLTISIGFSHAASFSAHTFESLVNRADKALYTAKNAGRNILSDHDVSFK